jgi:hypothetical protein
MNNKRKKKRKNKHRQRCVKKKKDQVVTESGRKTWTGSLHIQR